MASRVEKAQKAFKKQDVESMKKAHSKDQIHNEPHKKERGRYLGDFVYGALDGIITTFAVVSGVEGARLSPSIILILGFANLFADGVSMAVGNYLSNKSELEYIAKERQREEWEIENYPEGEKEEIRKIYQDKGFTGKDLDRVVKVVTSDKDVWVNTMMKEELGLIDEDKTPVKSGAATFLAFVVAGFVPLAAFVLAAIFPAVQGNSFMISIVLTGMALFIVGASRTYVTGISWIRSGVEMLAVGGLAAGIAYGIGYFLQTLGLTM